MKKRLRKKLKVAEFQELGFLVEGKCNEVGEEAIDLFFEKLISFADDAGLQCGGGYTAEEFEIFVNTGLKSEDNAAYRQKFIEFFSAAKEIKEFEASELFDANYDDACSSVDCDCGCC